MAEPDATPERAATASSGTVAPVTVDPVTVAPVIVVCLSPSDAHPDVDPLDAAVRVDDRRVELCPAESAALEHALRVGAAWDMQVVALCAGGPAVEPVLRDAAALGALACRAPLREPEGHGADSSNPTPTHHLSASTAVRHLSATEVAVDPVAVARVLAAAVRTLCATRFGGPRPGQANAPAPLPALVFCGDRSALSGSGSVPALLAHHLGAAQALGAVALETADHEGNPVLLVERRLDQGWRERLRLRPPAVISVEGAGTRLRRGSLHSSLRAARAGIEVIDSVDRIDSTRLSYSTPRPYRPRAKVLPSPEGSPRERLLTLSAALSSREPPRVEGPLSGIEAARLLLDYLHLDEPT